MSDKHSRIIAAAAKAELAPIGFQQKGRSRLWFADRGSWLNAVEFTPIRWSKSASLMNAAHWLWVGAGFMSFNEAVPSNCHAEFETEDQFRVPLARWPRLLAPTPWPSRNGSHPLELLLTSLSNALTAVLIEWVQAGGVTKQASPWG